MAKKILIATISMLDFTELKQIKYRKGDKGEFYSTPASYPSIPMIEWAVSNNDDIKIVVVKTNNKTGTSNNNLELFKKELSVLSTEMGVKLEVSQIVEIEHNENYEKQISIFKQLSKVYEDNAEVYMDLTYGTKTTSIALFSSLVYAEKIKKCNIKSIIYGKYTHDGSDIGEIYDMRCLYELSMLVNSLEHMPEEKVETLINNLWG